MQLNFYWSIFVHHWSYSLKTTLVWRLFYLKFLNIQIDFIFTVELFPTLCTNMFTPLHLHAINDKKIMEMLHRKHPKESNHTNYRFLKWFYLSDFDILRQIDLLYFCKYTVISFSVSSTILISIMFITIQHWTLSPADLSVHLFQILITFSWSFEYGPL